MQREDFDDHFDFYILKYQRVRIDKILVFVILFVTIG